MTFSDLAFNHALAAFLFLSSFVRICVYGFFSRPNLVLFDIGEIDMWEVGLQRRGGASNIYIVVRSFLERWASEDWDATIKKPSEVVDVCRARVKGGVSTRLISAFVTQWKGRHIVR